ncbi:MAG: sigma-70 family RNA polymerase sigma factor [Granulosicoccaceae bacterium]
MSPPPTQLDTIIELTVREEWGRLLASLVAGFNDIQLAEDVLQDAVTDALTNWQQNGLPQSPAAWLLTTARHKAIDRFRRNRRFAELQPDISYLKELEQLDADEPDAMQIIPDKRLELMFTCCHPALDKKSQIALTLRTIAGLNTEEIAKAFIDKPGTLAKRLTRAKQKIALAGIPYGVPGTAALEERISEVLAVIYLIYNEGYSAATSNNLIRQDLSEEAIRLARIAFQLLPKHCETGGLLALMLLHDSRRPARQSATGKFVSLEDQDRTQWNKSRAKEGRNLIKSLLPRGQVGPYQLQASVSALHTEATTWQETDWPQVAALYRLLHQINPTPVVHLNLAVAVSHAESPDAALRMLNEIGQHAEMHAYQSYHVACADIFLRAEKTAEAQQALVKAIELTKNETERTYLESKRILN